MRSRTNSRLRCQSLSMKGFCRHELGRLLIRRLDKAQEYASRPKSRSVRGKAGAEGFQFFPSMPAKLARWSVRSLLAAEGRFTGSDLQPRGDHGICSAIGLCQVPT
jgi:hypothetical protein